MLALARRTFTALLGVMALAACSNPGTGPTPAPSSGPAFEVASFDQQPCGQDVCVTARLKNMGDHAGSGTCQLIGTRSGPNGDESVMGPRIILPVVASGDGVTRTARWSGPFPNGGLRLLCDPGLLM